MKKNIFCRLILPLLLMTLFCGMTAMAEEVELDNSDEKKEYALGYIDDGVWGDYSGNISADSLELDTASLPGRFDIRDYYTLPAVRNQGKFGTCWAQSVVACMEINLIKKGLVDSTVNLSELQLCYYLHYSCSDPLGTTQGDSYTYTDYQTGKCILCLGGKPSWAVSVLSDGMGLADEADVPAFKYSNAQSMHPGSITSTGFHDVNFSSLANLAYSNNKAKLIGYGEISNDKKMIKAAIKEYGAVSASYYHDASYLSSKGSSYYLDKYPQNAFGTNHAITVVGWDDSYSKNNFKTKPAGNGAWIVRNSWGSSFGKDGYFYISYYDKSFSRVAIIEADLYNKGEKVYHYDGVNNSKIISEGSYCDAANVYKSVSPAGDKIIALGAEVSGIEEAEVTLTLYTDLTDPNNPESGVAHTLSAPVTAINSGFVYLKFDTPVEVAYGSYFSIVYVNRTGYIYAEWGATKGQSYGRYAQFDYDCWRERNSGTGYSKLNSNFCLKAYSITDGSEPTPLIKPYKYKIKFVSNAPSGKKAKGSMTTLTKYSTNKFKLPANKFKINGYTFKGWNTKKNGKGIAYSNKASIKQAITSKKNSTITLYAQWKKK